MPPRSSPPRSMASAGYQPNGNGWGQRYAMIIQTVTVVAMFFAGFWAAVISPMVSRQDKIETKIEWFTKDNRADFLSIHEHQEFKQRVDKTLDAMSLELIRLREGQVTRGEHLQKWASDAGVIVNIQRQIDDIKRDFGQTYSLKDALSEMQKRLERVEGWSKANSASNNHNVNIPIPPMKILPQ